MSVEKIQLWSAVATIVGTGLGFVSLCLSILSSDKIIPSSLGRRFVLVVAAFLIIAGVIFWFTVDNAKNDATKSDIRVFLASNTRLEQGQATELSWDVQSADRQKPVIAISPDVYTGLSLSDSRTVSPRVTTVYTLTVNPGSPEEVSRKLTIYVTDKPIFIAHKRQTEGSETGSERTIIPPAIASGSSSAPGPTSNVPETRSSVPVPEPKNSGTSSSIPQPQTRLPFRRFLLSTLTWDGNVQGVQDVVVTQPSMASIGLVRGSLPGEQCRITVVQGSATLTQTDMGSCQQLRFRVVGNGMVHVVFRIQLQSYRP